ncbi:WD domain, G-beta repeat containing protein, putative [Babesia bigemina]|uniref:WD domain, G-beta repeat containing protein, putative n=1 Tax=Babesia bigemina TaxID=5866 RepID=A0A061D886_BABBI|nr:WD domain, G-beta repeat containing protein, putative [Babesia bigemina]CDR96896.1 WD domain, G-beta repeat containing protein, putative [Babesia bigemina]|eukprot:XP_012769082.1 WD domain, G-beta repeat containing protein, putative [Babesia bigemina]
MAHQLSLVSIYDSTTSSVNAVAFSPCGQYIAAARQPFAVEIYNVETRVHITSLRESDEHAAIRTIIWIPKTDGLVGKTLSGYRIITIGLHAVITDWDLELLLPVRSCCSYGGAIFSAALTQCGTRVLIACDDGRVRAFRLWSSDDRHTRDPELEFDKVYACHTKSILSVCALPDGSFFCGTADAIIFRHGPSSEAPATKIKVPGLKKQGPPVSKKRKTGNADSEAEAEAETDAAAEENRLANTADDQQEPQIWALVFIEKHQMLASGDSAGNVILWDVKTCTMHKMFTQHCADVLCLAVGADGDTLFSGGVDTQITVYAYNERNYLKQNAPAGWSANGVKYYHKGDVRCFAVHPNDDRIVSSGSDGILTISRGLKHQNNKRCRTNLILLNIPSWVGSPVVMSKDKTLALCRYRDHCDLWYVPRESPDDTEMPYKLAAIKLKREGGQIVAAQLSPDASVMAIANQKHMRLLRFCAENLEIRSSDQQVQEMIVHAMHFVSNTELLLSHLEKGDTKFRLSRFNVETGEMRQLQHHISDPIIKIDVARFNLDEKLQRRLITLYSLEGFVYLLDLETETIHELPRFENGYRVVSTCASPDFKYLAVFSKGSLYYFYNVEMRTIIAYDGETIHRVPNRICNSNVQIYNAIWYNKDQLNRIFIQTSNNLYAIKIEEELFGVEGKSNREKPATENARINTRQKIYIGPRKFSDAPCIKKYLHQPPALFRASLQHLKQLKSAEPEDDAEVAQQPLAIGRYLGINKSKFLVHMELTAAEGGLKIIAFYMAPPHNSIFHRKRYGT